MGEAVELEIVRLGAQGDGVAEGRAGPVFVPFTLPGERVRVELAGERGRLIEVLLASPDRIAPACRHFGKCGGCALQHMRAEAYRGMKAELIRFGLAQRGLVAPIATATCVGHGARRRAVMAARRVGAVGTGQPKRHDNKPGAGILIGFHEAASHTLVPVLECPVLSPRIVAALPGLAELVAPLQSRSGETRLAVLAAENGLDVTVDDVSTRLEPDLRAQLARSASALGLVRLSVNREPVFTAAEPFVRCGRAEIVPPPGAFVQASGEAEAAMARLVMEAMPKKARRVADLFAGVGAFAFPLAERASVLAVDSDKASLAALAAAARHTQGIKPIETRVRDLFREPLSRKELEGFDAVVFDPPRAGAEAQAATLARSAVPIVVAVSCNPATLARDLRILVDGGYAIERVTPVDQFLYSPHIEAVAVLRRSK